jgi:hypothetical protein
MIWKTKKGKKEAMVLKFLWFVMVIQRQEISLFLVNSNVITELTKIYYKSLRNNHFSTPYIRKILSKVLLKFTSNFLESFRFVERNQNFAC